MSGWTLEQATELLLEQMLYLLDGCDDEDTVRPGLVLEALRLAWAPMTTIDALPDNLTAGEIRRNLGAARARLANGDLIP